MGKYKVPHFDGKGEANRIFTEVGVPTTLLVTSFYWENLIYFGMEPKRGPDGKLAFTLPMGNKKLASIAPEDAPGIPVFLPDHLDNGDCFAPVGGLVGEIASQAARGLSTT